MSWGKFSCTKEGFSKIKLSLRPLIYIFILSPPVYQRKISCQYTSTINVTYILLFCYHPCRKKSYKVVIRVFFCKHSRFVGQQEIVGGGGGGRGYFFTFSLQVPPASQTLIHQPGDYCREFISPHSLQPGSKQEPLISKINR